MMIAYTYAFILMIWCKAKLLIIKCTKLTSALQFMIKPKMDHSIYEPRAFSLVSISYCFILSITSPLFSSNGLSTIWNLRINKAITLAYSNCNSSIRSFFSYAELVARVPAEHGRPYRCCRLRHELLSLSVRTLLGFSLPGSQNFPWNTDSQVQFQLQIVQNSYFLLYI